MMTNEDRRWGPNRNETLPEVQARLDRQATANALVEVIAGFHGRAGHYVDPYDWARQVATAVLADFNVTVRK